MTEKLQMRAETLSVGVRWGSGKASDSKRM